MAGTKAPQVAPAVEDKGSTPAPAPTEDSGVSPAMVKAFEAAAEKAVAPLREEIGRIKASRNMGDGPPTEVAEPEQRSIGDTLAGGQQPQEHHPITGKDADEGTGINFVRLVKARAAAHLAGEGVTAEDVLLAWGYTKCLNIVKAHRQKMLAMRQAKTFGSSIFTDGGSFVPEQFSAEVIAYLRNLTSVRKLGARVLPMPGGNISMGRQTGGATASYGAEGVPITTSKPTTDRLKLSAKKLTTLCPVSNDLIRVASIDAEAFVRTDLMNAMATREDLAFITGTGSQDEPKGIVNWLNSANRYPATAVAPKAPTLAELGTEFAKFFQKLEEANMLMANLAWLMAPRTKGYLMQVRDSLGNYVYKADLLKGMLEGKPYVSTNQIVTNGGGTTDESKLILQDFNEVVIGDTMGMEATVAPNGTYEENGVAKSGLSRDETVIRLIAEHDIGLRYDKSGIECTVRWGAP